MQQQFAYWREVVYEAFAALDPRSTGLGAGFSSSATIQRLGECNVAHITSAPQTVSRDFSHIRIDPQDRLFVNLQLRGEGYVRQGHRDARVGTGFFSVVDIARPYLLRFDGPFELLSIRIPRDRLMPLVSAPNALTARPIDGNRGIGRLAVQYMRALYEAGDELQPESLDDLHEHLCGHLCELIARASGDHRPLRSSQAEDMQTCNASFVRAVKAFASSSLDDPDLSVGNIARRFGVSVRYVHKAFTGEDTTAAAWIRGERLRHCAQDLANPADTRLVSAIAARWGFNDIPNFTKAFTTAFGSSPSRFRNLRR
ncbi:helix-turn-helix domain-containing protein [Variovorax sp. J31P207]|uniref:AraC-like ligand-binding domain-containing protein n=1 Tax=Variovorax sp. J31P207 TaxID=3053510 RepID=UPI002575F84A|nr:helix-turn-helix domain-containing protein [Variovorax sp. J31P207]MDM0071441.1 helix-turn-helix domain-containing protein [Variovorax sp. J31P207]